MIKINSGQLVALTLSLVAVAACATQSDWYSFSFGFGDNQGIEILNYGYGDETKMHASPPDWAVEKGQIGQSTSVFGPFSTANYLYVKWRVLSTGKVYEDTVQLKDRLPLDMNHKRIHFLIKGQQLYVYLIAEQGRATEAPDCPAQLYHHNACTELYPEQWSNF